jgi:hypothetical protein
MQEKRKTVMIDSWDTIFKIYNTTVGHKSEPSSPKLCLQRADTFQSQQNLEVGILE